jgi:ribose transport system substrate-binding protein
MVLKKRLGAVIGMAAVTALAAACSSGQSTSGASGTKPASITVGFVPSLASDPYFVTMHTGAQEEAKKLGVNLIWSGSTTTYSPSAQIPYVDAVLAKHPSAFVLVATDANAMDPSVQQAVNLHIPVLTADSTVTDTSALDSRIAGNNTNGGQLAAQLLAKSIGDSGQVLMLEGVPGITPDEQRAAAFIQQLKEYPNITYVGDQFSNDQPATASSLVSQELARYPNLKGIFAIDDTTAEGVVSGLQNQGKLGSVKVVAYDAEPTEVAALEQGKLVGLIAQQPALEGQLAVQYAVDAAEGKTSAIPKVVSLPNVTITTANYKQEEQYFYQAGS